MANQDSPPQRAGGDDTPTVARGRQGKLERTLGLKEAVTIGLGTMVGAGIFVFPGLAVEQAGPAAALSFVLGAGIALLVALPTSELATAMPRSGGGYYFVSRALGSGAGSLVGIGQWMGLVFASAFYLAGFGHYLADVLSRLGLLSNLPPEAAGFATALALTAVGILGTRTSGGLQLVVVSILMAILGLFLGWGVLRATGTVGSAPGLGPLMPRGSLSIFTTAALIFTSYLGFAQIANVAGEVKNPGDTLPRAMLGSIVVVGLLYAVTILVGTAILGTEAMGQAGETAMTEVGRALLGAFGALVIGAAGLLATLSSANASILSSSRAVFALSRDGILPEQASQVSRRFRTPHVAILMAGLPISLLVLLGRLEVLAEVASILHLFMYGLICLSAVVLGRKPSLWYRPVFRAPGSPVLPILGALACFGLLAFMGNRALLYSAAVLAGAGAWYLIYARDVKLRGVEELAPAPGVAHASLLIQMELPDPPGLPEALIRALSPDSVVLLGWVQVPEQSSAEQVQDEMEEEAEAGLAEVARRLEDLGMSAETELVFTGDLVQTMDRVAEDRDVDAALSLRPRGAIDEILVALKGSEQAEEAAGYAARVARAADAMVRIVHPGRREDHDDDEPVDLDTELRRTFLEAGLRPERLRIDPATSGERPAADQILDQVGDASLVILGSAKPEEEEDTYRGLHDKITRKAEVPVLIVRPAGPREFDGGEPEPSA